jgi:superfamily II DNA helicase RecQ
MLIDTVTIVVSPLLALMASLMQCFNTRYDPNICRIIK